MNANPRRFRRGDTSPERPGLVFYQYKVGKEYWVTPKVFKDSESLRKRLNARWQKANPEKSNAQHRKWLAKPGSIEKKKQAYLNWVCSPEGRLVRRSVSARYRLTTNGTIVNRVRSRIAQALKRKYTKSASTRKLLGCSIAEFRTYLEGQFQLGMSWRNFGSWEIDHRVPLSSFNLADPEQQKLAFNFRNCQPMWREANRKKSNKMIDTDKILQFRAA